jgi:C-terminal processing protease CtpA/Prc
MELSPGFTDRVMQRIDDYERKQRRRRAAAFVLSVAGLVGGVYAFRGMPAGAVRVPEMVQRQPSPAAQPSAKVLAKAGILPGDTVITIDGRELHGKELQDAVIQMDLAKCTSSRIGLVRNGKQVSYTVPPPRAGSGPCKKE